MTTAKAGSIAFGVLLVGLPAVGYCLYRFAPDEWANRWFWYGAAGTALYAGVVGTMIRRRQRLNSM